MKFSRMITTAQDEESHEKGDSSLLRSASPECSWSLSSKGCILPGVEPKDVCGSWGCQHVFHHLCQTEWEFFQYRLDYPQGDPKDCTHDSGGLITGSDVIMKGTSAMEPSRCRRCPRGSVGVLATFGPMVTGEVQPR